MTEFDRIFRHFYFRDIANELTGKGNGDDEKARFLEESGEWTDSYFAPGHMKTNRRLMFFAPGRSAWAANAAAAGKTRAPAKKTVRKKTARKKTVRKKAAREKTVKKRKVRL